MTATAEDVFDSGFDVVGYTPNRHIRGARITKQNKNWQPATVSGDSALAEAPELLLARVREQAMNSPLIKRAGDIITQMTVGGGIHCYSNPATWLFPKAEDEAFLDRMDFYASESDWLFDKWAEKWADAEGRDSWWKMQAQQWHEFVTTGDGLLLRVRLPMTGGRPIPDAYQLIEREQLSRRYDRPASEKDNAIIGGIEIDSKGRPLYYYVHEAHPYDIGVDGKRGIQQIPANRMNHLFDKHRPSAHSGVSAHIANMPDAKDFDRFVGATIQKQIVSAYVTAILSDLKQSRVNGLSGGEYNDEGDLDGDEIRLGMGNILTFNNAIKVDTVQHSGATDATAFGKFILLLQSMGINISYARLTGDCASINFSAGLLAQANDHAYIQPLQDFFVDRTIRPVRESIDRWNAILGRFQSFTPREWELEQEKLTEYAAIGPGMPELNPTDEVEASHAKLRSCQTNLLRECGKRGVYWVENMRQRQKEERLAKKLGLVIDLSKGQGSVVQDSTGSVSSAKPKTPTKGAA